MDYFIHKIQNPMTPVTASSVVLVWKGLRGSSQPGCVQKLSVARLCGTRAVRALNCEGVATPDCPAPTQSQNRPRTPTPGSCAQQRGFTSSHLAPSLRYFYTVLLPFPGRRNKKAEKHFLLCATISNKKM